MMYYYYYRSIPSQKTTLNNRERRPDRQVYIPRALRKCSELGFNQETSLEKRPEYLKSSMANDTNNTLGEKKIHSEKNGFGDQWRSKLTCDDGDLRELQRASEEINRSNRRIMKQSFNSDILIISDEQQLSEDTVTNIKTNTSPGDQTVTKQNVNADDWETIYDDNGDCIDPSILKDLTEVVGKVSIAHPTELYKFQHEEIRKTTLLADDHFGHVLEVYDFPAEFQTQDLLAVFTEFKTFGFEIKWVDNTHALAVFSSVNVGK